MTQSDSASNPDEQKLDELLACLRQIEPPLETRIANRATVASEIARIAADRRARSVPFWQRTVAIPWPVVAATIAVLITLSASRFRPGVEPMHVTNQNKPNIAEALNQPRDDRITATSGTPKLAYRQSMTYLCGIGPLRSETSCFLEEPE